MNIVEETAPKRAAKLGRVLVVEDDRLVALDLETMLMDFGFMVCPTAHSADEALRNARASTPDLVLMDIRLDGDTDGVSAAEQLHEQLGLRVVYLTANSDLSTVERAKQTQPYGYLLKPIRPLDLRCCLELALHQLEVERSGSRAIPPAGSPLLQSLSAREVEVLTLIARGHTSKDIAHTLHIAKPTVDTYRGRLTDKLGIKSRAELVSLAATAGLLSSPPSSARAPEGALRPPRTGRSGSPVPASPGSRTSAASSNEEPRASKRRLE